MSNKWGGIDKTPIGRILNIYITTVPSRSWSIIPHSLSIGCREWLPSKENSMKSGGNNFAVEKSNKHYLNWVIKININSEVMLTVCTLDMMWWERYLTSMVFPPKTITQSTCEKNIRQTQVQEYLTKYLTISKLSRSSKKKEGLKLL